MNDKDNEKILRDFFQDLTGKVHVPKEGLVRLLEKIPIKKPAFQFNFWLATVPVLSVLIVTIIGAAAYFNLKPAVVQKNPAFQISDQQLLSNGTDIDAQLASLNSDIQNLTNSLNQ